MLDDIILIMTPPWEPKRAPLGLAYIAEYLKSRGFRVHVIDFNLNLYRAADSEKRVFWDIHNINVMVPNRIANAMFDSFMPEIDNFVSEVLSLPSRYIGFSVNIASIGLAGKIATQIKKKDKTKKIIFGGTGCFWQNDRRLINPEDLASIDAFIIGEGEEALERFLETDGGKSDDRTGFITQKEDFLKPVRAAYSQNLDRLPFPKFREFDLNAYTMKQIPLVSSRGCIGRCAFCIDHLMCGAYRYRSAENILEEIIYHINVNKISSFAFNDLICNGHLRQLERLCDLIIDNQIKITWGSYAMVRKEMSSELLKKMHRSGCIWLCYGLESGCDRTLKRMNKFYNAGDAERTVKLTHEAGICCAINIIVGFPGESEADFNETLSFIKRNRESIDEVTNVSSFVIMPPSRIGLHLSDYHIKLPLNKDLNHYIDENGLDFMGRIKRVRKTLFLISSLGIRHVIVNQSGLERATKKGILVLLNLPVARIDLPSLRIARLYSYLRNGGFDPVIYDFNIRLYRSTQDHLKNLWSCHDQYLWSSLDKLLRELPVLSERIFELMNELVYVKTDLFYFPVEKGNFIFSLKVATLLKSWLPSSKVVFGGLFFKNAEIKKLIPEGAVDMFIVEQEEEALCRIMENRAFGQGAKGLQKHQDGGEKEDADFGGFDLVAYDDLRLPLSYE